MTARKNGHATKLRPKRAPRVDRGEVASGAVEWRCTRKVVREGMLGNIGTLLLHATVRAQTWFFARQEGARLLGCEPGQVTAERSE